MVVIVKVSQSLAGSLVRLMVNGSDAMKHGAGDSKIIIHREGLPGLVTYQKSQLPRQVESRCFAKAPSLQLTPQPRVSMK
jgi:hypothetical protein